MFSSMGAPNLTGTLKLKRNMQRGERGWHSPECFECEATRFKHSGLLCLNGRSHSKLEKDASGRDLNEPSVGAKRVGPLKGVFEMGPPSWP